MQDSVLTLGERIVLAARLATIEHIRCELAELTAVPAASDAGQPTPDGTLHQQLAEVLNRALAGDDRRAA